MKLTRSLTFMLATAGVLGLVISCGGGESDNDGDGAEATEAPAIEVSAEAMAEAKEFFALTCVTCHGDSGKGDGPAAIALDPKPANYTDPAWQAAMSNGDIAKTILEGGAALGKSAAMISYKSQLGDKPEVVDGLVMIIRGYGK